MNEFVQKCFRFCDGNRLFIPHAKRPVGGDTAFSFDLNDGSAALRGLGLVLEQHTTSDNRYGRPGVVIEIRQLQPDTQRVFDEMSSLREKPLETKSAPAKPTLTALPTLPRAVTSVIEIPDVKQVAKRTMNIIAVPKSIPRTDSSRSVTIPPKKFADGSGALSESTVRAAIERPRLDPMSLLAKPAAANSRAATQRQVIEQSPAPTMPLAKPAPANGRAATQREVIEQSPAPLVPLAKPTAAANGTQREIVEDSAAPSMSLANVETRRIVRLSEQSSARSLVTPSVPSSTASTTSISSANTASAASISSANVEAKRIARAVEESAAPSMPLANVETRRIVRSFKELAAALGDKPIDPPAAKNIVAHREAELVAVAPAKHVASAAKPACADPPAVIAPVVIVAETHRAPSPVVVEQPRVVESSAIDIDVAIAEPSLLRPRRRWLLAGAALVGGAVLVIVFALSSKPHAQPAPPRPRVVATPAAKIERPAPRVEEVAKAPEPKRVAKKVKRPMKKAPPKKPACSTLDCM